jgi:hypothetical protein
MSFYNQISRPQIEILRVLDTNANARLVLASRGYKGAEVVTDYRREKSQHIVVPPMTARWLSKGGFVALHRRESEPKGPQMYAITSRGRNYAKRDLRGPLTLAGTRLKTPIKELILALVNRAGTDGITAATINERLSPKLPQLLHYKTVGMTLFRFSDMNPPLVEKRRVGKEIRWYAVAPKAKPTKQTPVHIAAKASTNGVDHSAAVH